MIFGHLPDKGEFIESIMNEGCPAFVKRETITPIYAAKLIRSAGRKVILAHPVAYKYEDKLTEDDILSLVRNMRADGIEANYIYIDRYNNKINEVDDWNRFAVKHNLKTTIGSDFHNNDHLHPVIGLLGENVDLGIEEINDIINYLLG